MWTEGHVIVLGLVGFIGVAFGFLIGFAFGASTDDPLR
jgi:hypothetical protein